MTVNERRMLDDALHVVFGRAARIAIVGGLCFAVALGLIASWGPHYTTTVRLMAAGGQERPGRSARDQAELLRNSAAVSRVLPALLASRPHAAFWEAATARLGLAAPEMPAAFAARVGRALSVRAAPGTNVIEASFTWTDPAFAARALNLIVAGHQRTGEAGAATQEAVLAGQARVATAQSELDALDRQQTGDQASEALRDQRLRVRDRLAASRSTADQARLDRALAGQRADALRTTFQNGGWVEAADADGGPHPLTSGLAALLDRRQQLLTAGKQDSAALRALDREMGRARAQAYAAATQIADNRSAALDDRLGKSAAAIADDEAALASIDQQISRADVVAQARQAKSGELERLQAALSVARTRVAPGWQAAELVSSAAPPAGADWPRPVLLVVLSAFVSLGAGLASAVRAEARRLTVDRADDLPRLLGIETLACVELVRV